MVQTKTSTWAGTSHLSKQQCTADHGSTGQWLVCLNGGNWSDWPVMRSLIGWLDWHYDHQSMRDLVNQMLPCTSKQLTKPALPSGVKLTPSGVKLTAHVQCALLDAMHLVVPQKVLWGCAGLATHSIGFYGPQNGPYRYWKYLTVCRHNFQFDRESYLVASGSFQGLQRTIKWTTQSDPPQEN